MAANDPSDPQSLAAFKVFNGLVPIVPGTTRADPKALLVDQTLTAAGEVAIDFEQVETDARLAFIQGVFIDNSYSANVLTLTASISGHMISIPGNYQGFFPLLAPPGAKFTATLAGAGRFKIHFLNFPVPAHSWAT